MWHIGGNYSHEFEKLNERINTNTSINLDKASKLEILTEYAEINPNPNPLGVAYIDNFEGASEGFIVSFSEYFKMANSLPVNTSSGFLLSRAFFNR